MEQITLTVKGMTCDHCVHVVTTALKSVEGVKLAKVELEMGQAKITFDPVKTSAEELRGAILDSGYQAELP